MNIKSSTGNIGKHLSEMEERCLTIAEGGFVLWNCVSGIRWSFCPIMYKFAVSIAIKLYNGWPWTRVAIILGGDKGRYHLHMVETKHYGPCSKVVIKMKNKKPLILFLSTRNVISRNSDFFFFTFIFGANPQNFGTLKCLPAKNEGPLY